MIINGNVDVKLPVWFSSRTDTKAISNGYVSIDERIRTRLMTGTYPLEIK
jgi:hypothetical protein